MSSIAPIDTSKPGHILTFLREMNQITDPKEWEYVMYILVNSELGMSKGKIASQCCHSTCRVTRIIESSNNNKKDDKIIPGYQEWLANGEPMVVLKATKSQLEQIIEKHHISKRVYTAGYWCVETVDSGRTQIEPNSLTTLAFCPMRRKDASDTIKDLKLL